MGTAATKAETAAKSVAQNTYLTFFSPATAARFDISRVSSSSRLSSSSSVSSTANAGALTVAPPLFVFLAHIDRHAQLLFARCRACVTCAPRLSPRVHAQQPQVPVIGFLSSASSAGQGFYAAASRNGLKEGGYLEGNNVALEYRWADGRTAHKSRGAKIYSITSSAIASTPDGTVRPSALAVLRLITNSNLVDCMIGRSAGLSPLRTPRVAACLPIAVGEAGSVTHQPAGRDKLPCLIDRRD